MVRSDAELIDACLGGDQQAWHELVTRFSRLVYSIPRRKGFSADDSDDVFQNVFTIVYRQLPNLRQYQSLPAWLITITQRHCGGPLAALCVWGWPGHPGCVSRCG